MRGGIRPAATVVLLLLAYAAIPFVSAGTVSPQPRLVHQTIFIEGNAGFTAANGVTGGSGNPTDPYLIEGWAIDIPNGTGIEVRNTTAAFTIRQVEVRPTPGLTDPGVFGVSFLNVSSGTIDKMTFNGTQFGFFSIRSRDIRITNTSFVMPEPPYSQTAVTLDHTRGVQVWGVEIRGHPVDGIVASSVSDLTVDVSEFRNVGAEALWSVDSASIRVRDSAFYLNALGISVANVTGMMIARNAFEGNEHAIQLASASGVDILRNDIRGSLQEGIGFVHDSRFSTLSSDVRVYHNTFADNQNHVAFSAGATVVWDDGYPAGGNHWSGYMSPDRCRGILQTDCSNRDGVVDRPFQIDALGTVDRYPLVRPFTDSRSPPVASLSVRPPGGNLPSEFRFDATASTDAQDPTEFLEARWDFDGDGTFETNWSSELTVTHQYATPGAYHPRVQVRDTDGMISSKTIDLVVSGGPISPALIVGGVALVTALVATFVVVFWWRRRSLRLGPGSKTPKSPW